MRSKLDLHGSIHHGSINPGSAYQGRDADRLGMSALSRIPRMPLTQIGTNMPLEWLDGGSWRLPSGKALAEFALQAGFLAPLVFKTRQFGRRKERSEAGQVGKTILADSSKQFGKGSAR